MFYIIQNVTNPNATSFTFNLTGWATLRFRMRAVNRFGPSRASVATTKVCQTDFGREYTFSFSTVTWVSEMWGSRTFPPPPLGQGKLNATVADPDLQIRGEGGGGVGQSSTPWDKRRGRSQKKNCFLVLRASVWSKNKRGTRSFPVKNADFWFPRRNHVLCKSFKVTRRTCWVVSWYWVRC